MRRHRRHRDARRGIGNSGTVGLVIAGLWALHAAAIYLPGAGYLRLPILFSVAMGFLLWRMRQPRTALARGTNKSGIVVGLCCWAVAATLSAVQNSQTPEVILTYIAVFLSGGAMLVALSRVTLTPDDMITAIVGLAAGSLFPLIGGLVAFVGEWGIPDVATAISAWQSTARMYTYEMATFGNRGNTAGFLLIVTPALLALVFDRRTATAIRLFCAATLVLIGLNLMVLQVRAAFVALFFSLVAIWIFKRGMSRLPVLAAALGIAIMLLLKYEPDAGLAMTERLVRAITMNVVEDTSVEGRMAAIREGARLASENWVLGIGPGGALTKHSFESAHQFQVQQAMETGLLGFLGVMVLCTGVVISLARTMARGRADETNDVRFTLLIGPATFLVYAMIANAALNNASVNTWTVLLASMLALMPGFERRARRTASAALLQPRPFDQNPVPTC